MQRIYLDNSATTKIDKKVFRAMEPYLKQDFGNASSLHWFGQNAHEAITKSRQQVADFLGCNFLEVFFIDSATISDNLAIMGVVKQALRQNSGQAQKKPHIITSQIEHPAVLELVEHLEKDGQIEATYLPVNREGVVKIEDVEKAIKENTILVSIMYANNEIGVIQPIAEIAKVIKSFKLRVPSSKVLFHIDAVQGANYLDCNVDKLGVDLLTLSGHKIYGPKGIGVLYKRKGVEIEPIIFGGHQERGLMPGTENTTTIVGLGKAIQQVSSFKFQVSKIEELRNKLIDGILNSISGTSLNGSRENRLPNNANISFSGVEGESILMALDQKGVAVSTGSACASGNLDPSHVLMALGVGVERAHSSIRFTLGKYNTEKEIDYVLKILPGIIEKLRKISPLK
ncbi:MAG: aminotransferase class V-fold PLP-dependent enzyme [Candidatus Pacebacteria bacterium]|nr:aminotransferase class V-fold PLP-dependent enzyme [Candidatus Paceibacterota bacterium]